MKSFKEEIDKYLTVENVLWIFLILFPFLLKDSVIEESVQVHYFDYFKPMPFFILIGVIIILRYIKSNLKTKTFIFKWFFPVCLWINLYMTKEGNGTFVIIFIDILFCVLILWAAFDVLKPDNYNSDLNHGLISDDPIESKEENDSFDRRDYAKSIVSEIRKTVNKRAFNIAVTGAWGSGKTSFLNLIKGEMDKTENNEKVKFITVNYNPWDFKEDKIIGLDLLKTISHELANEKELQEKFKGLMVSLQGMNQSPWYKVIPYFLSGFSTEKSINDFREEIGKALQDQNKKLVIFLDDLDRLDGDEILEVFKTIRNSFDIANTFFILGFDNAYVADQIREKVKGNIENDRALEYLDKIFQMRLFMPSNSDYDFNQKLVDLVYEQMNVKTTISANIVLNNLREVYAILNSIKVFSNNKNQHVGDFSVNALLILEFIKYKSPALYGFMTYNSFDIVQAYKSNKPEPLSQLQIVIDSQKDGEKSSIWVNDFLKEIADDESNKVSNANYLKYFKYALTSSEFSSTLLFDAIIKCDDEIISSNRTISNEKDLLRRLSAHAEHIFNVEVSETKESKDFCVKWLLKILFEEVQDKVFYSYRYYINHFSNFSGIDDLKQKINALNLKQKINFIYNLKETTLEILDELLIIVQTYINKENIIDQYYWTSIYVVEMHSWQNVEAKNEYKIKFIDLGKHMIQESYLKSIQQYVSFARPGENRSVLRKANSIIAYYLIGF